MKPEEAASIEAVSQYLSAGGDLDVRFPSRKHGTLLHLAADAHELDVVRLLLSAGANSLLFDSDGKLPIDYSGRFGQALFEEYVSEFPLAEEDLIPSLVYRTLARLGYWFREAPEEVSVMISVDRDLGQAAIEELKSREIHLLPKGTPFFGSGADWTVILTTREEVSFEGTNVLRVGFDTTGTELLSGSTGSLPFEYRNGYWQTGRIYQLFGWNPTPLPVPAPDAPLSVGSPSIFCLRAIRSRIRV